MERKQKLQRDATLYTATCTHLTHVEIRIRYIHRTTTLSHGQLHSSGVVFRQVGTLIPGWRLRSASPRKTHGPAFRPVILRIV